MKSVIESVFGVLTLLAIGSTLPSIYKSVKSEAVLKVEKGIPSMERFTEKISGKKFRY